MRSLRTLAEELEAGDYLAWQAEDGGSEKSTVAKEITQVKDHGSEIEIWAEGVRGGTYSVVVDPAGQSQSWFHPPDDTDPVPLGPIIFAERTETQTSVALKRGVFDSRGTH